MFDKLKRMIGFFKTTSGRENENSTSQHVENLHEMPSVKETIKDDEYYKIEKTSQGKNRAYQIADKKNEINYELNIKQTAENIVVNVVASKDDTIKKYSRGAKAGSGNVKPCSLECNFLSTLKMKRNTDGDLIFALLKLTKDKILEAPSKLTEMRKAKKLLEEKLREEQQRKETERLKKEDEEYVRLYGMDKKTYVSSQAKKMQKIDISVKDLIDKTKGNKK